MKILLLMKETFVTPVDYSKFIENFCDADGNTGNRVIHYSLYKILNTDYNELYFSYWDNDFNITNYTKDEINSNFDAVVLPSMLIGIKSVDFDVIEKFTNLISGIRIPIYVFSLGMNVSTNVKMTEIIKKAASLSKTFADRIFENGGMIFTRGYITEEFFNKIGFDEVVAIGCQSLYLKGRGLRINNEKVPQDKFKSVMNGHFDFLRNQKVRKILKENPNSIYFDQDGFKDLIYGNDLQDITISNLTRGIKKYTDSGMRLYFSGRLKLLGDIEKWIEFLRDNEFSFSFGERVHGNIISLLAGVPAFICWNDLRSKEMVEFFNIPSIYSGDIKNLEPSLYGLYFNQNYEEFNRTYEKNIKIFEKYLVDLGLIYSLDDGLRRESQFKYQNFADFDSYFNLFEGQINKTMLYLKLFGYPIERTFDLASRGIKHFGRSFSFFKN